MKKPVFIAAADILNAIAQAGTMSASELAARFGVSPDSMRHHTKRLLDAGDIYVVTKALSSRGAQFAVPGQSATKLAKPVLEIVPPRQAPTWRPLVGHVERLQEQAALAMMVRR